MYKYWRTKVIHLLSKINRNSPYYLWLTKFYKLIPNFIATRLSQHLLASIPERRYLEETIFPALNGLNLERILFVGVIPQTNYYGSFFDNRCEYWTIDIKPSAVHYGSKNHVIGDVIEIDQFFKQSFFDLVIINGVFGYGINTLENQNRAFEKIRNVLKPNGIMFLGWDIDKVKEPLELEAAKKYFSHSNIASLPKRKTFDDGPHVYDFFKSIQVINKSL